MNLKLAWGEGTFFEVFETAPSRGPGWVVSETAAE